MNKKILAVSVLVVLMLVAISFATAINTTPAKKKESPLFGIRTKLAIGEKIEKIMENIKTKFIGERIFWIQNIFPLYKHASTDSLDTQQWHSVCCTGKLPTCKATCTGFTCAVTCAKCQNR